MRERAQACNTIGQPHDWHETGRVDVHVEFPTPTQGVKRLIAHYVRCHRCQQMGFIRRPSSRLVYTWARDSVEQSG